MNISAGKVPTPSWIADFCGDYTPFLFAAGKWTLVIAIVLGAALALAQVVLALRKSEQDSLTTEAAPMPPSAVIEAIKGFIQALAGAPTWLALFGGGVLLLWMAGNAVPTLCLPPGS